MQFAIATRLAVPDPKATADFLKDALTFQAEYKDGYGWWLENGAITIILEQGNTATPTLEVQCTDIERDRAALLQRPDIQAIKPISQQGNRIEQLLHSDCGINLMLSKVLDEDEMGELLPLPTSLAWDEQVDIKTRKILRIVPLSFRDTARQRIAERAEYLCVEAGELCVQLPHAMQAFVDITLDFQYQALFDAMQKEGIDAEYYMQQVFLLKPAC